MARKSGIIWTVVGLLNTCIDIESLKDFLIQCVEGEKWHFLSIAFEIFQSKRSSHYYQTLGFRNSTFFPSYQPKVLMDEEDDISSVATDDTAGYLSVRWQFHCEDLFQEWAS